MHAEAEPGLKESRCVYVAPICLSLLALSAGLDVSRKISQVATRHPAHRGPRALAVFSLLALRRVLALSYDPLFDFSCISRAGIREIQL